MNRELIAVILVVAGGVALTIGGFLIAVPVGLLVLGAYLSVTGYIVGLD